MKYSPAIYKGKFKHVAHVSHVFYEDIVDDKKANYSKEITKQYEPFEYTLANIKQFIADNLSAAFNEIVVDDNISIFEDETRIFQQLGMDKEVTT